MRWTAAPTIVAEALVGVPDALLTALRPGPPASGSAVVGSLARSLSPPEHPAEPASWLLPNQVSSFRRVLAAIHRYRGALLADAVGSGKTFIALAVAATVNRGPTVCLVPATLMGQWQAIAARLSIAITLCSHEQVSRGKLPKDTRGLVLIDESHHFRNQHTRRYRHLAPWLVGRSALLMTATPIVNRVADLAHQLLLTIRDDALAPDGVVSLRAMLGKGCSAPALGQLIFEREAGTEGYPSRLQRGSKPLDGECSAFTNTVDMLDQLRLSRCEPTAKLIRGVLLRALASSPASLAGALRRYRRLLLHARDASQAGRAMDRAELRRFVRELGDQLVWWELLPTTEAPSEIELGDLSQLEQLIRVAEAFPRDHDGKLSRLRKLLDDDAATLVFTVSRDTVRYIRDTLADFRVAWCTGERAGIGRAVHPREAILGWFREPTTSAIAPRHLVVTDLAAEGLDLKRAARVVHYDLPWTPMRLEQREGRAVRYGSSHSHIETIQFALPPLLERRLRLHASLAHKVKLPGMVGLGLGGEHVWRWRTQLGEQFRALVPVPGVASIACSPAGLLAGFSLSRAGELYPLSASVLWLEPGGGWTDAPETIGARLEAAARDGRVLPVDCAELTQWLGRLARPIRDRVDFTRSRRWITPDPTSGARRAMGRLQALARDAARRRQARRLSDLDQALRFVAGGHTAGEAALVEKVADASDPELAAFIATLPTSGFEWSAVEVRLTGLIVFGASKAGAVEVASGECPVSGPPSSTLTEP